MLPSRHSYENMRQLVHHNKVVICWILQKLKNMSSRHSSIIIQKQGYLFFLWDDPIIIPTFAFRNRFLRISIRFTLFRTFCLKFVINPLSQSRVLINFLFYVCFHRAIFSRKAPLLPMRSLPRTYSDRLTHHRRIVI